MKTCTKQPSPALLMKESGKKASLWDLHVNQASLTGESLPAEKEALAAELRKQDPVEDRGMVFLGASVVSGAATAVVVATVRVRIQHP